MRGRDGFILVATLGVLALLASLAGGVALLTRGAHDGLRTASDLLRLDALVRAGIELAAHQLIGLRLPPDRIAGEIRLDDGTVRIAASDEAGRIDLNWSDPLLLAAAAQAAGLRSLPPAAFAAAAVAWRTRNEPPPAARASRGADGAAPIPKRDGFRTVGDLRWIPGLTAEEIGRLSELLTVHNPSGKVNPLAASDAVLLGLPGATPQMLAGVAALRRLPPAQAAEQVARIVTGPAASFVTARPGRAFRLRVEAERPAARRAASVVLIRAPPDEAPYFLTEWSD
ncbi:type II secretion system protein GspK [Methylobacterium sp. ID0610]|uniref:type II secretion system protein GspK n=1 Tax=Methylobacterium carpenticola TaxID=3344827 RepID=UPI00369C4B5C